MAQRPTDTEMPADRNSAPIQTLRASASVNIESVGQTPDNDNALPSETEIVLVSATQAVWIMFGVDGVTVTAAESGSILIPGGGVALRVAPTHTHFAVVAQSATVASLCVAKLE